VLHNTLSKIASQDGIELLSCQEDSEAFLKCVAKSFGLHLAKLSSDGKSYSTILENRMIAVHQSSIFSKFVGVPPSWIVVPLLKKSSPFISAVNPQWVIHSNPHLFSTSKSNNETDDTMFRRTYQPVKKKPREDSAVKCFLDSVEF